MAMKNIVCYIAHLIKSYRYLILWLKFYSTITPAKGKQHSQSLLAGNKEAPTQMLPWADACPKIQTETQQLPARSHYKLCSFAFCRHQAFCIYADYFRSFILDNESLFGTTLFIYNLSSYNILPQNPVNSCGQAAFETILLEVFVILTTFQDFVSEQRILIIC